MQGITTELTGEGTSIAPLNARMIASQKEIYERYKVKPDWTSLAGYWKAFERARPAVNMGTFVGAGGVRDFVMGEEDRAPTAQELKAMEAAVAQAMEEGAFGLSTSLQYMPDRFASTEEILALAKVAARYGGSYITRIAREAKIPAQVYHLKTSSKKNWGRMPAVLKRLDEARAEGLDVSADQYPYTAGQNDVDANLPLWVREGGVDKMIERLKDPATRARIKAEIAKDDGSWENQWMGAGGPSGVLVVSVVNTALKKYEGKTFEQIGKEEGKDPLDAAMDLVIADRGNSSNVIFMMSEADVRAALKHPFVSFCTDSSARAADGIYSEEKSHPRAWGSATRILAKYVREEKLLSLEEAVRKMTSLPASRMGLADRGIVRTGLVADLVAFDPDTVRDRATYEAPLQYSEGMPYVAVNGQLVVDGGRITEARPGRPLMGPGYRRGQR
jgi:dihydroorotase/N-acyl-D-amino-acid deacylase